MSYRFGQLLLAMGIVLASCITGKVLEHGGVLPAHYAAVEPGSASILFCLAWVVGVFVVARLVDILVWDGFVQKRTGVRVPGLLRQLGVVIVIALGIVGLLNTVFGMSIGALMTASGALGIVVGLAFKDLLSDFFSGIVLNLEQPFWLDEWIAVGEGDGCVGCVKEISWRSTRIETSQHNLIIIRNGYILTAKLVNYSRPVQGAEFEVEIQLDFSADPGLVRSVFEAATSEAAASNLILSTPPPKHYLKDITPQGLTYIIAYSIDLKRVSRKAARDAVLSAVARQMRFTGIEPATSRQQMQLGRMPPPRRYTGTFSDQSLRLLQHVEFLRSLTDSELADLVHKIKMRKCPAGETVVTSGEEGSSMFIVVAGHLDVTVKPPGNAEFIRVATLGPGDFFGEMSLLTGEIRTATVTAIVPSVVYEITHEIFASLIESRPELVDELSRFAAERRLRNEAAAASSKLSGEVAQRRESLVSAISQSIVKFFARNR